MTVYEPSLRINVNNQLATCCQDELGIQMDDEELRAMLEKALALSKALLIFDLQS